MHETLTIAKYFLLKGSQEGIGISPMKLQKLIYFAHGWFLAIFNRPLIKETIQAWKYGPVIPVIYDKFQSFGNSPISIFVRKDDARFDFKAEEKELLDFIWDIYKGYSAIQLSNLTHVKRSPWDVVLSRDKRVHLTNVPIDNELIKVYFQEVYVEELERNGA